MYVTRLLSHYKKNPEALSLLPEGPNSGYLVIQDEEAETNIWFGSSKNRCLETLPFPRNNFLSLSTYAPSLQLFSTPREVVFIPVINQPLSSNRYYAIEAGDYIGRRKGYM